MFQWNFLPPSSVYPEDIVSIHTLVGIHQIRCVTFKERVSSRCSWICSFIKHLDQLQASSESRNSTASVSSQCAVLSVTLPLSEGQVSKAWEPDKVRLFFSHKVSVSHFSHSSPCHLIFNFASRPSLFLFLFLSRFSFGLQNVKHLSVN